MSINPEYAPQTVRVVNVKPVNHLLHGTLTLLTGGMWGIVWIFLILNRNLTR
jgi:hypothetical protein